MNSSFTSVFTKFYTCLKVFFGSLASLPVSASVFQLTTFLLLLVPSVAGVIVWVWIVCLRKRPLYEVSRHQLSMVSGSEHRRI